VHRFFKFAGAVGFLGMLGGLAAAAIADDISGAGATFPYPVYAKWAEAYKQQTGIGLNYQSIGSGGGIKQIEASTVTFGASDKPLEPADLKQNGLVQWPQIIGGVVPVVNIPGIKPGELVLDGATLASIYLGDISRWNDPAIKKLNPTAVAAQARHCADLSLRRFGHQFSVHQLSVTGQPGISRPSAPTPRCNGRWASAPRATRAWRIRPRRPAAPSAMSNTPTSSRPT
jgi:ABC-type phosphate transport system substrate-binding protein